MAPGRASATARERARASLTADIKEEARRQLATVGADALSLRAVARELGMVSSALYRYFPSKDDLLTALIIDAYNAVGEVAETAVQSNDVAFEPEGIAIVSTPQAPGANARQRVRASRVKRRPG